VSGGYSVVARTSLLGRRELWVGAGKTRSEKEEDEDKEKETEEEEDEKAKQEHGKKLKSANLSSPPKENQARPQRRRRRPTFFP